MKQHATSAGSPTRIAQTIKNTAVHFVTGLLANAFYAGSSIEPREQSVALEALKELQSVK